MSFLSISARVAGASTLARVIVLAAPLTAALAQHPTLMAESSRVAGERVAGERVATESPRAARDDAAWQRLVTIRFDEVALVDALRQLTQASGLQLGYTERTLPRDARVTYRAANVAAGDVLLAILKGLPVGVERSAAMGIKLVPARAEQAQGTITGHVTSSKNKQAVRGATVLLDDATKGVMTDEDGTFRIPATAGAHTLTVRAVGFLKQSRQVTVTANETASADFALDASASVLNEVIVTGTVVATERKAIPTPITVITAKDLEQRNITRIEQLFRGSVPGVVALETGMQVYAGHSANGDSLGMMATSKIYARGASTLNGQPNPLKTYIDGVELLDPSYLGTIDPTSIERIEIITGPQAATIYGANAMGGVMQIFTKKGNGDGRVDVTAAFKYGFLESNVSDARAPTHNHTLTATGGSGPAFSYSANTSYRYTGQWRPDLWTRSYGASASATHTRGRLTVGGGVALTKGSNGATYGSTGNTHSGLTRRDLSETGVWNVNSTISEPPRIASSQAQTLSLNLDYRPFSAWQHHVTIGRNETTFDLLPADRPLYAYAGSMRDTLYISSSQTGERLTLGYNTTWQAPSVGVMSSVFTVGMNGGSGTTTRWRACTGAKNSTAYGPCDLPNYAAGPVQLNKTVEKQHWGGFGSMRFGLFDQLFVTLGLRGESNPNYGRDHKIDWTPTNGVAYTMEYGNLTMKLLGSYGRVTRPPQPEMREQVLDFSATALPNEVIYQLEAPDLTPEYSRGPQGGIELYYGSFLSLTINHYSQRVTNLIQRAVVDSVARYRADGTSSDVWYYSQQYQYQNTATVRQYGWDGTGTFNVGPLALQGTYAWTDSRILSLNPKAVGATSYYAGQSFFSLPTHMGNLTVTYALGKTSVTLVNNYIGQRPLGFSSKQIGLDRNFARIKTYLPRMIAFGGGYAAPGYVKSDLSAQQRLTSWITATLNVMNLGNNYGTEASALYPTLGRQTSFGLSFRFPPAR